MYLQNPGPIREYLAPGVEVVSVDPDCVYSVDDSDDDEDQLLTDSDESESSGGEDYIIDVEGNFEASPRRIRKALNGGGPATGGAVHQTNVCPTTTTTVASSQTCLGKPHSS